MVSGGSVGNDGGGVDSVSNDGGGVHSVSNNGSGVDGVGNGVGDHRGVDSVGQGGVDAVSSHSQRGSVGDNSGSKMGGKVSRVADNTANRDGGMVANISGGQTEESGNDERLKPTTC